MGLPNWGRNRQVDRWLPATDLQLTTCANDEYKSSADVNDVKYLIINIPDCVSR
jgi:hypothetical protein